MVAERQRSESSVLSIGDTYMPPPSYDDVKVNGASQHASADGGPKTAKSLYFLAEVLLDSNFAVQQSACCVEGSMLAWFVHHHIRSSISGVLYIGIGLALWSTSLCRFAGDASIWSRRCRRTEFICWRLCGCPPGKIMLISFGFNQNIHVKVATMHGSLVGLDSFSMEIIQLSKSSSCRLWWVFFYAGIFNWMVRRRMQR